MLSSVRLWSHDAVGLNGLLLENIIVLLPCIFAIAAKVTSEFLPTGWARSTGSAWAWWISRSAGKMVCVLFKLQVEAKGRFWRRWRDPSTLHNGFHPLVSSLKAAFFFLLRRCRCRLGIYYTGWEQCKISHIFKSWWSVIWVHFKVGNSHRTFWPLLFEFRWCIYLFVFVIVLLYLALNLCHGLRNLVKAITDRHIARLCAYACVCSRGIEVFWQWMTNVPAFIFPSVPIAKCINSDSISSSSEGHRVHHRFLASCWEKCSL